MTSPMLFIAAAILGVAIVIGLLVFGAAPAKARGETSIADIARPDQAAAGPEHAHLDTVSQLESQIRQLEVSSLCARCLIFAADSSPLCSYHALMPNAVPPDFCLAKCFVLFRDWGLSVAPINYRRSR